MALPLFENEADIPELFRAEYVKGEDGKWRSKADAEIELERQKRVTLLDEKKVEERKAKDAQAALADLQRTIEAKSKGVSEEELQSIREAEAATRKPIEDERDTLKAENRKLKLTDRVRARALHFKVMVDRIDDAMMVLEKRTELGDADGIVFKDATGKITAQNEEQFFAAMKVERPWWFEFDGGSGSGSGGSDGRGAPPATATNEQTKDRQRSQIAGAF